MSRTSAHRLERPGTRIRVGPGDYDNANHAKQWHNLCWPCCPVCPVRVRNCPDRVALSDTSDVDRILRSPSGRLRLRRAVPQRRMSLMAISADGFVASIFCLIFATVKHYDEPEILPSQLAQFCLIGADAGQFPSSSFRAVPPFGRV